MRYGREHYRPHSAETSSLILRLLRAYSEDPIMSQRMQEFVRETIEELLSSLPPEELRKHLPPEERLKGLPPEERAKGMSDEEVLRMIRALPPATRDAVVRELKANGNVSKPQ